MTYFPHMKFEEALKTTENKCYSFKVCFVFFPLNSDFWTLKHITQSLNFMEKNRNTLLKKDLSQSIDWQHFTEHQKMATEVEKEYKIKRLENQKIERKKWSKREKCPKQKFFSNMNKNGLLQVRKDNSYTTFKQKKNVHWGEISKNWITTWWLNTLW